MKENEILKDFKEVLSLTKRYLKQEKERGVREIVINAKCKMPAEGEVSPLRGGQNAKLVFGDKYGKN